MSTTQPEHYRRYLLPHIFLPTTSFAKIIQCTWSEKPDANLSIAQNHAGDAAFCFVYFCLDSKVTSMGTSPYNALTSRGIVLVSVSPSQNALDDPSFELFGEPENPESITRLIGTLDSLEVNTIAYDLGEVVREAVVPASILESSDASTVLNELLAIPTLTDIDCPIAVYFLSRINADQATKKFAIKTVQRSAQ